VTVGRIVHYYTTDASRHRDGIGQGPYAALVVRVHDADAGVVNLRVFTSDDFSPSSVERKRSNGQGQYWEWPPRA
jgi:hypothetical protein